MKDEEKSGEWVTLCAQSELPPGNMRGFDVAGFPPVALFNVAGCVHATSNICTHNVAILTDGSFDGRIVECPLHGGSFDVTTGEAVSYPCEKGIEKFQVRVVDERISIARIGSAAGVETVEAPPIPTPSPTPIPTPSPTSVPMSAGPALVEHVERQVEIRIEDSTHRFRCGPDDTLLRAALRGDIGFPYECNSGGCGSCTYRLVSGEMHDVWPDAPGLSVAARARGTRLACQSVPRSDCVIQVRERPEFIAPFKPSRHIVTLERITRLTRDMAVFHMRGDGMADFLPGQYAMLGVSNSADAADAAGNSLERAYSMANTANGEGRWEFIVKEVAGGRFSSRIASFVDIAGALTLDGPYGNAYLRPDSTRPVLCIAGGAGLSPMLSILRGAVQDERFADRPLSLFYGGRTPQDLCDALVLEADEGLRDRVEWINAISDGDAVDETWGGRRGFIHEVVRAHFGKGLREHEIYLSGPPPMTDAVQRMLVVEQRIPASQIHFDRFC
ncbi:MAG: Rieske 2Fe-2S domain-containing protein [Janthinobacterium lividum]